MMEYRWDLEDAKPDPLDYKMALDLAISSTMMDIELGLYPWLTTPSYPRYSTQQTQRGWTNYDTTKFLFKLHRLSKGKMDWSKSWRLRLLLNNK